MNKFEIVAEIAQQTGLPRETAQRALDALTGVIASKLSSGEEVKLVGFGVFTVTRRNKRKARNPHTGAEVLIPVRNVPIFKPGKVLKEAVF